MPADHRTPILLTATARATVLSEMRTMLGSVQGVLEGASRSDTVAIKAAALASGVVMAADPALENELPKEFLQLGMTVHRAFDSMAANAAAGPNDAVKRLATIAATCVECHALYRIQVK
ncbi:MAG: hypothetical protein IPP90_06965 [Gemmatimonadaceae bacterium]|nr:hypothetical protein [Gemmatimonadaceae bacterium]